MRPLVKALQGGLVEVYFFFVFVLRIDQVTSPYAGIWKKINTLFKHIIYI